MLASRRAAAGVRPAFALEAAPAQSSCPGRDAILAGFGQACARSGIYTNCIDAILASLDDHMGCTRFLHAKLGGSRSSMHIRWHENKSETMDFWIHGRVANTA